MENRLTELLKILHKQLAHYRQLGEVLRHERECITNAQLSGMQECVFGKEAAIEAIKIKEQERARIMGELSFELRIPVKELNLTRLVKEVEPRLPKSAQGLRSVQVALQLLTEKAHELNVYNRGLLEKSLEHFHRMKRNVLGESHEKSSTYSAKGQQRLGGNESRLLSREI